MFNKVNLPIYFCSAHILIHMSNNFSFKTRVLSEKNCLSIAARIRR